MTKAKPAHKRILLKLSGEAFGGGSVGVDPDIIAGIAGEIVVLPDAASTAALAAAGYLTADEEARMHAGLDALAAAVADGSLVAQPADEDVHGALEAEGHIRSPEVIINGLWEAYYV